MPACGRPSLLISLSYLLSAASRPGTPPSSHHWEMETEPMSPEDTAKTAEDNGERDEKQDLKSLEATGSAFANATMKMKCKNMI